MSAFAAALLLKLLLIKVLQLTAALSRGAVGLHHVCVSPAATHALRHVLPPYLHGTVPPAVAVSVLLLSPPVADPLWCTHVLTLFLDSFDFV